MKLDKAEKLLVAAIITGIIFVAGIQSGLKSERDRIAADRQAAWSAFLNTPTHHSRLP